MKKSAHATRKVLLLAGVAAVCLSATACNRRLLGVFFDLPEAQPDPAGRGPPASPTPQSEGSAMFFPGYPFNPLDTVTPAIERTIDPDSVLKILPRDHAGNVDWVGAIREGIIRPRNGIGGPRTDLPGSFDFKFDFYFTGPAETFDAYFPHSVHTQQVDCNQCHPRIFRSRGTDIKMADVLQGKFCGECHGKVAFNPTTACERCHTAMILPPDRTKPELIGTIQMKRATEIVAAGDTSSTIEGNASGVRTGDFPRARFPHWVHRIRFKCKTCHMEIFEPRAGTNAITMVDIDEGRFCGKCHNGTIAFIPQMTNCARCHPATSGTPGDGGSP